MRAMRIGAMWCRVVWCGVRGFTDLVDNMVPVGEDGRGGGASIGDEGVAERSAHGDDAVRHDLELSAQVSRWSA